MSTRIALTVESMRVQEVQVEEFKDYKKRANHGKLLANIDKVYWKLFLGSMLLIGVFPMLLAVCLMYLPVALIVRPLVNKDHHKLYRYERRIQPVAPKVGGVQPIELRQKKGAGE